MKFTLTIIKLCPRQPCAFWSIFAHFALQQRPPPVKKSALNLLFRIPDTTSAAPACPVLFSALLRPLRWAPRPRRHRLKVPARSQQLPGRMNKTVPFGRARSAPTGHSRRAIRLIKVRPPSSHHLRAALLRSSTPFGHRHDPPGRLQANSGLQRPCARAQKDAASGDPSTATASRSLSGRCRSSPASAG